MQKDKHIMKKKTKKSKSTGRAIDLGFADESDPRFTQGWVIGGHIVKNRLTKKEELKDLKKPVQPAEDVGEDQED